MNQQESESYIQEISYQLGQQLERLNKLNADFQQIKAVLDEFDISKLKFNEDDTRNT